MLFGLDFAKDIQGKSIEEMEKLVVDYRAKLGIKRLVVTLDEDGSVYADEQGEHGFCPAQKVTVVDTTGAPDGFFAGVSIGLSKGWSLAEACKLGTKMAAKVIGVAENVYIA